MIKHFANVAEKFIEKFKLSKNSFVIDIGSNDGTFLSNFVKTPILALGIDPSKNMAKLAKAKGVKTVTEYFNSKLATKVAKEYGNADVILTTNTFNHIDNLYEFMKGVKILLKDSGAFVIEVPQALELVKNIEFDTVYHEHLNQFTVTSISKLFNTFGMEIFDIDILPIHGGSMRVYGRKKIKVNKKVEKIVSNFLKKEKQAKLFNKSTYNQFREQVYKNRDILMQMLEKFKSRGKKIVGYGAPAKGNTLLNFYGIGPNILDYLVDRNTLKQGYFSPGMHIKIFPAEKIIQEMPDYVLILAWNFAEEIINQQKAYLKQGGKFIIPIPKPVVIEHK
jgi:SAM-dependent methyltransferase